MAPTYTFSTLGAKGVYPNVGAGRGPGQSVEGDQKVSPYLFIMAIDHGSKYSAHGFSSSLATRTPTHVDLAQNQEHSLNLEDAFDMESTVSSFSKNATSIQLCYESSFKRLPEVRPHNIIYHMASSRDRGKQTSFLHVDKDLLLDLPYILKLFIQLRGLCEPDSARRILPETFHQQNHITHDVDSTNVKANSMILKSKMGTDLSALCFRIRHRARLRAAQWHTTLP